MSSSARCAAPTHVPPQSDAALGSAAAQSAGGVVACRMDTDRLKRHARSVRNWSEWRSDMFRMLDEARGASA